MDRSLGKRVPAALRQAGHNVVRHDDLFKPDAPDEEWLERAGREEWIALTKDQRIRYRELERRAVRAHGLRLFVLVAKGCRGEEMAVSLVKAAKPMIRLSEKNSPPFIARVGRRGDVKLLVRL